LEELDLVKDSSGGAEIMGEVDFTALQAFGIVVRIRELPATAPGVLPRLAVACGEAIAVAFDPPCVRMHSKSFVHVLAATN
jgi:hypothetical protein